MAQLAEYEKHHTIPRYHKLGVQSFLDKPEIDKGWRVLYLFSYRHEADFAWTHFPKSMELILNTIPGVSTAFFSIVEPHTKLEGHFGVYEGVMR